MISTHIASPTSRAARQARTVRQSTKPAAARYAADSQSGGDEQREQAPQRVRLGEVLLKALDQRGELAKVAHVVGEDRGAKPPPRDRGLRRDGQCGAGDHSPPSLSNRDNAERQRQLGLDRQQAEGCTGQHRPVVQEKTPSEHE